MTQVSICQSQSKLSQIHLTHALIQNWHSKKIVSYILTTALHLDVFPVVHKVFLEYIELAGVLQP